MNHLSRLLAQYRSLGLSAVPLGLGLFLLGATSQSYAGAAGGILLAMLGAIVGTGDESTAPLREVPESETPKKGEELASSEG